MLKDIIFTKSGPSLNKNFLGKIPKSLHFDDSSHSVFYLIKNAETSTYLKMSILLN